MVCSVSRDPREFVVSYFYVILEHGKFGNKTSLELHYYETNQWYQNHDNLFGKYYES